MPHSSPADAPATRGAVALLVATALAVLTQLYAAIPLFGPVSRSLGGDATFALATSFSLTYAIGFLIWGPISDRYGRKGVLVVAVGILSLTTLLCSFATSLPVLALLRAGQGLAAAGFAPVALAYLTERVAPSWRAAAIGAMSTAFLVAGILGQVVASMIAIRLGWAWFFVIFAVVLMVDSALLLVLLTKTTRRSDVPSLGLQFTALGRLMIRPGILLLSGAHVTLLLSFVALYTALGRQLVSLGQEASSVLLIRLAALPAMFLCLVAAPLIGRIGAMRVAQLGFGLSALGLLVASLSATTLPVVTVASIGFVSGVALAVPSMISLYSTTSAPNQGSGMAINGFMLFTGASLGPILANGVESFSALMLVLVGLLGLAELCLVILAGIRSAAGA
ncbi:MAG: MFS transporter [Arachnia propionica]|uniref:MFS transporter n=1 Tax=Arachnia propionica TaxID=1750 RepID=UPI0027051C85|nr:MFS transporter [Arachnia propionica]